jgi:hypothetical protein
MKKAEFLRVPATAPNGRLNCLIGWKAIGRYLGCTARTARRWEAARGLPVHRIPGGDRRSVWAAPEQLKAWLEEQPPEALAASHEEDAAETAPDWETGSTAHENPPCHPALSAVTALAAEIASVPAPDLPATPTREAPSSASHGGSLQNLALSPCSPARRVQSRSSASGDIVATRDATSTWRKPPRTTTMQLRGPPIWTHASSGQRAPRRASKLPEPNSRP